MTAVRIEHRPSPPRTRLAGAPRRELRRGRRGGPAARPDRGASAAYTASPGRAVRACRLPAAVAVPAANWRLTDRGVTAVLVIGLMIMVAALTVVGLTALRVTGPDYRPEVSAFAQAR